MPPFLEEGPSVLPRGGDGKAHERWEWHDRRGCLDDASGVQRMCHGAGEGEGEVRTVPPSHREGGGQRSTQASKHGKGNASQMAGRVCREHHEADCAKDGLWRVFSCVLPFDREGEREGGNRRKREGTLGRMEERTRPTSKDI